jgi:hypothetical protein
MVIMVIIAIMGAAVDHVVADLGKASGEPASTGLVGLAVLDRLRCFGLLDRLHITVDGLDPIGPCWAVRALAMFCPVGAIDVRGQLGARCSLGSRRTIDVGIVLGARRPIGGLAPGPLDRAF